LLKDVETGDSRIIYRNYIVVYIF